MAGWSTSGGVLVPGIVPEAFVRLAQAVPVARGMGSRPMPMSPGRTIPVADALAFFVDCRQSRSGLMKGFTPVTRSRTRRRMNGNVSEWLSAVDGLPEVHARLRRVFWSRTCPPSISSNARTRPERCSIATRHTSTRQERPTTAYAFEMNGTRPQELLDAPAQCKGKVMLSGYPSELYDTQLELDGHTFDLPNNARQRQGETPR